MTKSKSGINVGSIIKWYDYYADGIVRDAGVGIVMQQEVTQIFNGKKIMLNLVYRFAPYLDWVNFTSDNLDLYWSDNEKT